MVKMSEKSVRIESRNEEIIGTNSRSNSLSDTGQDNEYIIPIEDINNKD